MSFNEILEFLQQLNPLTASLRVVLAVLLGGFIGLERGRHGRAAGLRTHILAHEWHATSMLSAVKSRSSSMNLKPLSRAEKSASREFVIGTPSIAPPA